MTQDQNALDKLQTVIAARVGTSPDQSYTAKLLSKGPNRIAKKFGEEAVELVIAAVEADKAAIISESADVLYHWLVLLQSSGVSPQDVYAELDRRHGQSGLEEKANRATD
jgi:phosphoribosyl-ATP pyrophosphohydrolase